MLGKALDFISTIDLRIAWIGWIMRLIVWSTHLPNTEREENARKIYVPIRLDSGLPNADLRSRQP